MGKDRKGTEYFLFIADAVSKFSMRQMGKWKILQLEQMIIETKSLNIHC
jgi:hypothetical protein